MTFVVRAARVSERSSIVIERVEDVRVRREEIAELATRLDEAAISYAPMS